MQVQLEDSVGKLILGGGRIDSTFGKTKFKCVFAGHGLDLAGLQEAAKGARLKLRYKRFVFDTAKKMVQD